MLDSRARTGTRGRKPAARKEPASQTRPRIVGRPVERARAHVQSNARFLSVLIIMLTCCAGLSSRLVYWQVMQHVRLSHMEQEQRDALSYQPPMRGRIFDANGSPLATDVTMNLVYAVPRDIKAPSRSAALLAPVLHMDVKTLTDLLTGDSTYVPLANAVDGSTSQKIQNLALPGIALLPQIQRYYPDGSTAAHVLGFVAGDSHGYWGVEGYYDRVLSGTAGLRSVLRDTAGNDIHISNAAASPSHAGADLHLSIDSVVQSLVEDDLAKAVKVHRADSGTIIVMDPHTGYILGMASDPAFNPNHRTAADAANYANPAIQDLYEPGSTFKIITMAAGLDRHVITPTTAFEDTGNFYAAPGVVLHNWNMSGFGWETMTQVLQHSANVGAAWVAQHLGANAFYHYIHAFQFGQPTGIDLQGEGSGIVPLPGQKNWSIVSLYTNAFGQGISVTPIQMIRAVSAVANNGIMMKPQIVKQMVYDGRVIDHPPVEVGRVISAQTAHTLTHMLVESAVGGEAEMGLVKGYNIAAKTGTANIPGPNGQYLANATIGSIIGYAPANHPRFIALIILRHPRDIQWGSMTAAPVLHDLFQQLFMYYHIPPNPHALYH